MAITVSLYRFEKRSNSTKRPSGSGIPFDCEIHDPTDVMAPVFIFNIPSPFQYNYMSIPAWERYYWITGWTYRAGLWEASCEIDPLASWRNEIGNMREYILRSSKDFDGLVVDDTYPLVSTSLIHREDMAGWSTDENTHGDYVIGIVGKRNLVEYYVVWSMPMFAEKMFGNAMWSDIISDDPGVLQGGSPSFMKAQFNPLQYVVSCMWYPWDVPHEEESEEIYFGYFASGQYGWPVKRTPQILFSGNIPIPLHPQYERGLYLQFAPYTRLRLSALPWGEIDLDTTKFCNTSTDRIFLEAWVDYVTGSSKLYISNGDADPLVTLVGQVGVSEQLSQVLRNNLQTVTGALQSVAGLISAAVGAYTGSYSAVSGGIQGAVGGIGNAVSAQIPDTSSTGTNGARIAVAPTKIFLLATHQYIAEEDLPNRGRPLCGRYKINTLPGFLIVSGPEVELDATKSEIDKIKEYMSTGFFYE